MQNNRELLKGNLEGCVLAIINHGQTYGYQITRKLQTIGFHDVVDGTVYTILLRMENNKLVDIEKKPSDKGPDRKFYTLNAAGKVELQSFWNKWESITTAMKKLQEEYKND